jgi:hypothetical protein
VSSRTASPSLRLFAVPVNSPSAGALDQINYIITPLTRRLPDGPAVARQFGRLVECPG